jgi:nucleoside-diphosphate-sugar epimerase
MVVGSGMMAQAFSCYAKDMRTVIFASGVSNSLETDPHAFSREQNLLAEVRNANPQALLVYFSTCSIEDAERRNTPYVKHKLAMESFLENSRGNWLVFRLPLVIGRGHRGATFAQFLYQKIAGGESFEIWANATRYPIDVEDVLIVAQEFIENRQIFNQRINVALRSYPAMEFVRVMEEIVGKKARYVQVDRGAHQEIFCPEVIQLAARLHLDCSGSYLERVLRKYFAA